MVNYAIVYDSQLDPVVQALKSMGPLSFDCLVYALLKYCGRWVPCCGWWGWWWVVGRARSPQRAPSAAP